MANPASAGYYPEQPKNFGGGYGAPPPGYMQPGVQYCPPPSAAPAQQVHYVQAVGYLDPSLSSINDWLAWSIVRVKSHTTISVLFTMRTLFTKLLREIFE